MDKPYQFQVPTELMLHSHTTRVTQLYCATPYPLHCVCLYCSARACIADRATAGCCVVLCGSGAVEILAGVTAFFLNDPKPAVARPPRQIISDKCEIKSRLWLTTLSCLLVGALRPRTPYSLLLTPYSPSGRLTSGTAHGGRWVQWSCCSFRLQAA